MLDELCSGQSIKCQGHLLCIFLKGNSLPEGMTFKHTPSDPKSTKWTNFLSAMRSRTSVNMLYQPQGWVQTTRDSPQGFGDVLKLGLKLRNPEFLPWHFVLTEASMKGLSYHYKPGLVSSYALSTWSSCIHILSPPHLIVILLITLAVKIKYNLYYVRRSNCSANFAPYLPSI